MAMAFRRYRQMSATAAFVAVVVATAAPMSILFFLTGVIVWAKRRALLVAESILVLEEPADDVAESSLEELDYASARIIWLSAYL